MTRLIVEIKIQICHVVCNNANKLKTSAFYFYPLKTAFDIYSDIGFQPHDSWAGIYSKWESFRWALNSCHTYVTDWNLLVMASHSDMGWRVAQDHLSKLQNEIVGCQLIGPELYVRVPDRSSWVRVLYLRPRICTTEKSWT